MDILTIEETKDFLRIEQDFTLDDTLLTTLISGAESYLETAVGNETFEGIVISEKYKAKAKIYCLALVTDWYENRSIDTVNTKLRPVLKSLLTQLKYGVTANA